VSTLWRYNKASKCRLCDVIRWASVDSVTSYITIWTSVDSGFRRAATNDVWRFHVRDFCQILSRTFSVYFARRRRDAGADERCRAFLSCMLQCDANNGSLWGFMAVSLGFMNSFPDKQLNLAGHLANASLPF